MHVSRRTPARRKSPQMSHPGFPRMSFSNFPLSSPAELFSHLLLPAIFSGPVGPAQGKCANLPECEISAEICELPRTILPGILCSKEEKTPDFGPFTARHLRTFGPALPKPPSCSIFASAETVPRTLETAQSGFARAILRIDPTTRGLKQKSNPSPLPLLTTYLEN